MQKQGFPFAVRLMGISDHEADLFQAYFELEQEDGLAYFCLSEDSLQDPDLYIANADDLKTLSVLSALGPSDARPALLVGTPAVTLPYPCVPRPIRWEQLFLELEKLICRRADTLSRLEASDLVAVPDRRRRERLDIDLTDPSEYIRMRRAPARGGVLVIDKSGDFTKRLDELLVRYNINADWVDSEEAAIDWCSRSPVSVVMINTSTPDVDPYRLCAVVKKMHAITKTAVIFLVGKPFVYNPAQARLAGADGILDKPLACNHVLLALKKFLPLSR
jgi:CheY-like chemotaxis protein